MPVTVGHSKAITIADGTNTDIVRPGDWNSVHAVTLNLSGTDLIGGFSNGGNVTFGTSGNSYITANAPTTFLGSNASSNYAATGFTTTTVAGSNVAGTHDTAGLKLAMPAFLTAAPAQTVQPAVGQLNGSSGTMSFVAGASLSATSNASTITIGLVSNITTALQSANANYLTSQSNQAFSASGSSSTFQTLSFGNTNGVSFSISGGSVVGSVATNYQSQGAYLTTAAQSDHSHGNPTLALTNLTGTTASGSNGLTLSISAGVAGAVNQTGPNIAAGGVTVTNGTVVFGNANGVSFGIAGSTLTANADLIINRWDNMAIAANTLAMTNKAIAFRTLSFFPLNPMDEGFPGDMTVNTMGIDLSLSGSTATQSGALTTSCFVGLYTLNTTAATFSMGLVNSVVATVGHGAAATNNSTAWNGRRWLTIHSSQWSSPPILYQGSEYAMGLLFDSAGASSQQSNTVMGAHFLDTLARSGAFGVNPPAAATWMGLGVMMGWLGTTTQSLPAGVNYTQINKQTALGNFIPHIQFNNYSNLGSM